MFRNAQLYNETIMNENILLCRNISWQKNNIYYLYIVSTYLGVVDQTQGHSPSDTRFIFLYERPSTICYSPIKLRGLGPGNS